MTFSSLKTRLRRKYREFTSLVGLIPL